MKLRFKDLGEQRWLCYATAFGTNESNEFKHWLKEHLGDRYMIECNEIVRSEDGVEYQFTLRGGDTKDRTMVALCWG